MTMARFILTASALTFVTVLAITDFRSHRIPNRLTVPAALLAFLINIGIAGFEGALRSGTGMVIGLVVFLPLFLAGKFGAGDVKGMAAVGAFLGPLGVAVAAVWTLIAGMLGGLAVLFAAGGWAAVRSLFGRWLFRASMVYATGQPVHADVLPGDPARRRFPYGFAIACGTAASLALASIQ